MDSNPKIYKYIKKENGDIHLKELVIDFNEYEKEIMGNGDIVLKIKQLEIVDTLPKLEKYDFMNSKIIYFKLCGEEYKPSSFNNTLKQLYRKIGNGKKIMEKTKLNIQPGKKIDKGYIYMNEPNLQISYQGFEKNRGIKEFLHQSKVNKMKMEMHIELANNKKINIKV